MNEITIDEQIKLLEEQLAGLRMQKKKLNEEEYCINKLNQKIIEAEKCALKVRAIYVSKEIYLGLSKFYQRVSNLPVVLHFYKSLMYKGYTIYTNLELKSDEIQIAI